MQNEVGFEKEVNEKKDVKLRAYGVRQYFTFLLQLLNKAKGMAGLGLKLVSKPQLLVSSGDLFII